MPLSDQRRNDCRLRRTRMRINEVIPRHYLQTAKTAGFGVPLAEELLSEVSERIESALDATLSGLPADFPSELVDVVRAGVQARGTALATLL